MTLRVTVQPAMQTHTHPACFEMPNHAGTPPLDLASVSHQEHGKTASEAVFSRPTGDLLLSSLASWF